MQANQTGIFYMGSTQTVLKDFPREFRSSLASRFDRTFLTILAICAVVMVALTIVLSLRPVSETVSDKEILRIQERYAQLVLNQPKPQVEETAAPEASVEDVGEVEGEKETEDVDRERETFQQREERKERTAAQRRDRREAVKKQVSNAGIFAAITATGSSGSGMSSGMTDFLGATGAVGDLGGIDVGSGTFATKGAAVGNGSNIASRRGETRGGVSIQKGSVGKTSGKQIASAGEVNVTSKPPEMASQSGKEVTSKACIQQVVNRQKRRLKRSFENWLKRDPELSGQLKIRFVILPGGSVSNVSIVSSTTNNSRFDATIVNYVKAWTFPDCGITESIEIIYPFAFSGAA